MSLCNPLGYDKPIDHYIGIRRRTRFGECKENGLHTKFVRECISGGKILSELVDEGLIIIDRLVDSARISAFTG